MNTDRVKTTETVAELPSAYGKLGRGHASFFTFVSEGVRIFIDCGYPASEEDIRATLMRGGIADPAGALLIITHFHPDHAGSVESFKALGLRHLLLDFQLPLIESMEKMIARDPKWSRSYRPLKQDSSELFSMSGLNEYFRRNDLRLTVYATPGHSDDSLSVLRADGSCFTGDLPPEDWLTEKDAKARESWEVLRKAGAKRIIPSHRPEYHIENPAV